MSDVVHNHASSRKFEPYTLPELMEFVDGALDQIDPERLTNTPPYEIGCLLERLVPEDQQLLLRKLAPLRVSEVLSEMYSSDSAEILAEMRDHRAVKILEGLEPDDAVDLLFNLDIKDRERLLNKLPLDFADTIRNLMCYDPDTAGGVMTPYVTTLRDTMTIDQAVQYVRREKNETENSDILFVVDHHRRLVGITTVRNLIWAKAQQRVSDIMERNIPGLCKPGETKQQVALIMTESRAQILPVVDNQQRLLGIITHDDVVDILHESATSDMQKLYGAGGDEHIMDSVWYSVSRRSPWLIINLFLSMISTDIISRFSEQIQTVAMLAAFLNLVMVLSDNAGSQSLAIVIRAMALDELLPSDVKQVYVKETLKGLWNGLIIGLVSALVTFLWTHDYGMSVLVLLSLVITVVFSGLLGVFVPIVLKKMKLDPANSSGIIVTAIAEPFTIFVFLWMGSMLLCQ